ncbi:CpaE family protein [Jannaschia sp. R86511]|uniref:AAA family ATPase n=1 Tax=Jannaschia sp. R86511 TaxID=3093853 RepID=UPI0036D22A7D
MNPPAGGPSRGGPVAVVSAVAGATESAVASALSGRRDLVLVRRCADVAELLSVVEAGLAGVAVLSESFPQLDADVVDRLRHHGCAVVGVVDPQRESSERLRAWGVVVVDVDPGAGPATGTSEPSDAALALARAVLTAGPRAAGPAAGPGSPAGPGSGAAATGRATTGGAGAAGGPGRAAGAGASGGADGAQVPHASGYSWPAGTPRPAHAGPGAPPGPVDPDDPTAARSAEPADVVTRRGRLVAVWGPAGAPGRTTVAVGVAAELAAAGAEVLLVDADTYAASVAQVLGLLDESPGLVAAVRAGLDGRLDPDRLARLAPVVAPRLRVLTGLTRSARWSELRPAGLQAVWSSARRLVDHVVVDLATPLEEDDELSYDTAAPRRNGAALDVLRAADDVLVVGSADPVGLQRLVRGLQDLALAVPGVSPQVVVNRVRSDAVGRNPRLRVREALDRFAGVRDLRLVPDDRPATDRALLAGRTLHEAAPDSPASLALRATAAGLPRPEGPDPDRSEHPAGEPAAVGAQPVALAPGRRVRRRRATGG